MQQRTGYQPRTTNNVVAGTVNNDKPRGTPPTHDLKVKSGKEDGSTEFTRICGLFAEEFKKGKLVGTSYLKGKSLETGRRFFIMPKNKSDDASTHELKEMIAGSNGADNQFVVIANLYTDKIKSGNNAGKDYFKGKSDAGEQWLVMPRSPKPVTK